MRNANTWEAIAVLALVGGFFAWWITAAVRSDAEKAKKDEAIEARFVEVGADHIRFSNRNVEQVVIIEDKRTGIKYLYHWGGRANGGPSMCRLWNE